VSARRPLHTWERLSAEIVYECRIFSLRRDRSRFSRDDAEHEFHVLESPDWCNIIPLTADQHVVMVRQFRHGLRAYTLEVPGGMIDADDPSPLVAARREMVEESGYDSDRVEPLGVVHPNPAIQTNRFQNAGPTVSNQLSRCPSLPISQRRLSNVLRTTEKSSNSSFGMAGQKCKLRLRSK